MTGGIIIKKGLSALISCSGLFSALDHYRLADKAFILMYHRVLCQGSHRDTFVQPGMYVTSNSFDSQVSFLKKTYNILLLEELIEKINRNEKISGCCAITFDDGWRDNYSDAFAILKKYDAPATIFLATAFIGTNKLFWPEEICWYFDRQPLSGDTDANSSFSVSGFKKEIEKYSSDNRELYLNNVIETLKRYSPYERNKVLDSFRVRSECPSPSRQMLNWEEANEMIKSGLITFGAHTAQHEILDQLSIAEARTEILQSKNDIEQKLGVKVSTFAYPNGNCNESIQNILREYDFVGAVTTRKGFLSQNMPLLEIPRIGIHEDICNTVPMFRGRILLETF